MNIFPTMTQIFASTTPEAVVFFNAFLPWVYLAVGVVTGITLLNFMIWVFRGGLDRIFHRPIQYSDTSEAEYRKKHHLSAFD